MSIAIIVLHYGDQTFTQRALQSLKPKIGDNQCIIVNNSQESLIKLASILPKSHVIDNHNNLGFAAGVNVGLQYAVKDRKNDAFLILNNDTLLTYGALEKLTLTLKEKSSAGIVAPVLHHHNMYDWGGKFNRWFGTVTHRNFAQKPKTVITVDHIAGAAFLISRDTLEKVGLFDERFFLYYEDVDYCLRTRMAGLTLHINPEVVIEHAGSSGTSRLQKTLHEWKSHIHFVAKYLPVHIYPTAILYDILMYPLFIVRSLI